MYQLKNIHMPGIEAPSLKERQNMIEDACAQRYEHMTDMYVKCNIAL